MGSRKHNSNKTMVRTILDEHVVFQGKPYVFSNLGATSNEVYIALVPHSPHVDLIRRPP